MKPTTKMQTPQATKTQTDKARLRRLQLETIREITMKVLAKCGPMTAAERQSAKRKPTRTKKAE